MEEKNRFKASLADAIQIIVKTLFALPEYEYLAKE